MAVGPAPEATTTYPPAGLERRFHAFALDRLVAWPLLVVAVYAGYRLSWSQGGLWLGVLLVLAWAVVVGGGTAVLLTVRGTTPGKAVLGLRVVDVATGRPLGPGPALVRSLLLGLGGLPTFGLGDATLAQTAVLDPDGRRQGWHDRVAGSVVVDVRPAPEVVDTPRESAPRQVVNLTAMRLVPAIRVPAAPVARPAVVPAPRRPTESSATVDRTPVPSADDPGKTVVRGAHRAEPQPDRAGWRLTFDTGESLLVDGLVLVGRRPEGRPREQVQHLVPLPSGDMSLSKTHAQVQVASDGALVVVDRGSTNGSVLVRSGVARDLVPGRPTTLLPGDSVTFGDRSMSVAQEP